MDKLIKNKNKLLFDVSQLIKETKLKVASVANSKITILFWNIGNRINKDVLENSRAEYGK